MLWGCISASAGTDAKEAADAKAPKADKKEAKAEAKAEKKAAKADEDEAELELDEPVADEPEAKKSTKPSPSRVLGNTGIGKPSLGNSRIRSRR